MVAFFTRAPRARRTLIFGSTMHVWSDLFFALMVPLLPIIKEDMDLSFTEVGLLRSVFNGASGVLQIPAGFLFCWRPRPSEGLEAERSIRWPPAWCLALTMIVDAQQPSAR